jgi:hypothetical protein
MLRSAWVLVSDGEIEVGDFNMRENSLLCLGETFTRDVGSQLLVLSFKG